MVFWYLGGAVIAIFLLIRFAAKRTQPRTTPGSPAARWPSAVRPRAAVRNEQGWVDVALEELLNQPECDLDAIADRMEERFVPTTESWVTLQLCILAYGRTLIQRMFPQVAVQFATHCVFIQHGEVVERRPLVEEKAFVVALTRAAEAPLDQLEYVGMLSAEFSVLNQAAKSGVDPTELARTGQWLEPRFEL